MNVDELMKLNLDPPFKRDTAEKFLQFYLKKVADIKLETRDHDSQKITISPSARRWTSGGST